MRKSSCIVTTLAQLAFETKVSNNWPMKSSLVSPAKRKREILCRICTDLERMVGNFLDFIIARGIVHDFDNKMSLTI
jgi:hypothetical protein